MSLVHLENCTGQNVISLLNEEVCVRQMIRDRLEGQDILVKVDPAVLVDQEEPEHVGAVAQVELGLGDPAAGIEALDTGALNELGDVNGAEADVSEVLHVDGHAPDSGLGAHHEVDVPVWVGSGCGLDGAQGPTSDHTPVFRGLDEKDAPVANNLMREE